MTLVTLPMLLTPRELAEQLDVTEKALSVWRQQGRGPRWLKCGGQVRYRADVVAQWLADCERTSTAAG